jgi:hypothetical protein
MLRGWSDEGADRLGMWQESEEEKAYYVLLGEWGLETTSKTYT